MNHKEIIQTLQSIIDADKTPEYDYGTKSENRAGNPPPTGSRWMTPREICKEALEEIEDDEVL